MRSRATLPRLFREPSTRFFLFGPRGTGKSTWIAEAHPEALRIDLLAPELHRAYLARPERLRERIDAEPRGSLIVIAEVQRVPALLDVVPQLIESKDHQCRFILRGTTGHRIARPRIHEIRAKLDPAARKRESREGHRLYPETGATGHAARLAKELGP